MAIGSGVLLPVVAENPTFPILSALAYTTGLATTKTVIHCYGTTYSNVENIKFAEQAFTFAGPAV